MAVTPPAEATARRDRLPSDDGQIQMFADDTATGAGKVACSSNQKLLNRYQMGQAVRQNLR
jgi:hypothetical protein